ncbi:MAG: 23S rRNA (pseudouridine(1915)-N(3))-methyltransferase RlmH [Clostridiales bacterium]|nr:23S rRNA (pseudouridine(1915)-N(3))-methyltransferase RlmH [Clostridiales bacterium]
MEIRIISPGKTREKWLIDGIEEYRKRLSKYCKTELVEVEASPDNIPVERALEKEGELMLSKIKPGDQVWAIDLHGNEMKSEEISKALISSLEKGGGKLTLVIGGSNGISPKVTERANLRLCLGKHTMTHTMTRLIILEQIYRGFKIYSGENYHK